MTALTTTPFTVEITDAEIDDLRQRLRRTRWPEKETVEDSSQGIPLGYVQELCSHWADQYDMGVAGRINAFPQARTEIDGLGIHFLHVRSPEPDALPLVLTHGWPGSVVEFLEVLGPLSDPRAHGGDPADAFHVVAPSLPGYGWSDKPVAAGWGIDRIAPAWIALMEGLGYERFGAQGGDWGAVVTTAIGRLAPAGLVGIHLNMAIALPDPSTMEDLTPTEQQALADIDMHQKTGTGYSTQQSTRPQTLGYGLTDSPAGQCAWVAEKFWAWTDCEGVGVGATAPGARHPENAVTRQQLLDNISVYWFTQTAASSARLYWESFRQFPRGEVTGPAGITIFPKEIFRPSRRWAEAGFTDLRWFEEVDRGGHFAAMEEPDLFVDQLRGFFRTVR